jgi:hypothetical protein
VRALQLQLHVFVFDENFKTLQGRGGAINLANWYSQQGISILQMTSVCGSEEVALVDSSAQVRVFSFVTVQFRFVSSILDLRALVSTTTGRPASIKLQRLPSAIYSSPDGSCLLVLHTHDSEPSLKAYHWETFGSSQGIFLRHSRVPS